MKIRGIILAALPLLAAPAWANTWTGTMSWTLTSLSGPDPYGQIGDTFTGSYSYESPTEDYDSYLDPYHGQDVSVACAVPNWMLWETDPTLWGGATQISLMEDVHLSVNDGVVTFYDTGDMVTADYDFWQDRMTFAVKDWDQPGAGLQGAGTVQFSSPIDPPSGIPASVPDAGSTALMLGLALAGLAICRKHVEELRLCRRASSGS